MSESGSPAHPYGHATLALLKLLARGGGSLRTASLFRAAGLPCDELCEMVNQLAELRWLRIALRRRPHATLPARLGRTSRVTLTRLGRARLPVPWEGYPKRLSRRRVVRRRPLR